MTQRWIVFLVVAALPLLAACGSSPPEHAAEPRTAVTVTASEASLVSVDVFVEASGAVEPRARVSPGTKILGRIDEVPVREGDQVRAGQMLARLERRDLEASVAQARAAVAMAEAGLENAQAQFERMTTLHGRGSVTDKNLEDATAGHRMAQAALAQAQANLRAAEVTLGYAEVRSPLSGWVVKRHVEAGDMASPGAPLFVVEDLSRVKIAIEVAESDVVGMSVGDPARVRIDVLGDGRDARIDRIIPSGDTVSRTYRVELSTENDGAVKSGMFARARFPRGTRKALVVPEDAVIRRGELTGLFLVANGRAQLRWVRLGGPANEGVEVLSGLAAGESYVTTPPADLSDGAPVEVR